jgi:hypothetical protein
MSDIKQNPFRQYDPISGKTWWKWRDETGAIHHKYYPNQLDALQDLLRYIKYLNKGPNLWQKYFWWPLRYDFWPLLVKVWRT